MSSLKFGTSGLRGLVTDLTDQACMLYARAFIVYLRESGRLRSANCVLVGRDLRFSSPAIAKACLAAIGAEGLTPIDCGALPTPALALHAMHERLPAIMVTGSHIPDNRNGLKFYRADGEIDKADEAGILAARERVGPAIGEVPVRQSAQALERYKERYRALWPVLAGLRIAIYQHSSVARDVIADVLRALGAEPLSFARAEDFVSVDTEALRLEDVELARAWAAENKVDAIVSTDGDADRPLIADENGTFLRGDIVGVLTAQWLGADVVVTPVTSSSAIEASGLFGKVIRSRVGSPYVIEAMGKAQGSVIVGFEANGGVLLGSDMRSRRLDGLPTRDAMLPIIAVLALARQRGMKVSDLVAGLPARFTASDRLKDISAEKSGPFLRRLADDKAFAARFASRLGTLLSVDITDGVRMRLVNGDIVHFRASGNAPELRCYSEADEAGRADELMRRGLAMAREAVDALSSSPSGLTRGSWA